MNTLPCVIPETSPVTESTVATALLLLVHKPPVIASDNNVTSPLQTWGLPEIESGNGFTVSVNMLKQPSAKVYVITDVPTDTAVSMPVALLMVATVVSLEIQVMPVGEADNTVVPPAQVLVEPCIGLGWKFTVTAVVVLHPVGSV